MPTDILGLTVNQPTLSNSLVVTESSSGCFVPIPPRISSSNQICIHLVGVLSSPREHPLSEVALPTQLASALAKKLLHLISTPAPSLIIGKEAFLILPSFDNPSPNPIETCVESLVVTVHDKVVETKDFVVDLDSQLKSMVMVPCTQFSLNGELVDEGFSSSRSLNRSSESNE